MPTLPKVTQLSHKVVSVNSLKSKFNDIDVTIQSMKVKDVVFIHYVAVRGKDNEEGAVQRVLNKARIKSIRDYLLTGKIFFNAFLLNWTEKNVKPEHVDGIITIPIIPYSAQVIDGQHRLAGLQSAMEVDPAIGEKDIVVILSNGLSTAQAADIFLNINTEQKPVPKSLIFNLFGIVENDKEHAINRAKDIASDLNENIDSAYYKMIKFPGSPWGVGHIDLSTIVTSLKKHLEPAGIFSNYNITDLNRQKVLFINYFNSIRSYYLEKDLWSSKGKNPFTKNAGVVASIEFFIEQMLPKCAEKRIIHC
ncbi:DGQHR domain-containing protein [Hymenobacter koreensis]|uniref:DGQHR domain-containing protein n=1 Tax=Hymenobacter koreensis TaxID=1084523 RepID=A0ABP8IZN4_9BACT